MTIGVAIVVEEDGRTTEVSCVEGAPLETARSIAKRIDNRDDGKKSYEDNGYIFNVLTADAVVYLCAGKSGELKGRVAFDFLAVLKTEYERGGYEDKQNISSFERFASAEIKRYSDPAQVDKITKIQGKVEDVKKVALDNLDRLLVREGKIEEMVESTDKLKEQGSLFSRVAAKQKCLERKRNLFWTVVLALCCIILLALIIGIIVLIVYTS